MTDSSSSPPPPAIDTAQIAHGALSVTPNLLTAEQTNALRADAKALHAAGAFLPGGLRRRRVDGNGNGNGSSKKKKSKNESESGMKTTTDETTRICDICGLFDDAEKTEMKSVGNREARDDLLDLMADLRELLQLELGVKLSEGMELQYLRYPGSSGSRKSGCDKKKKGFYGRHFDSTSDDDITCRRKVSLLLYLNEDGWDGEKDGGILRAYVPSKMKRSENSGSDRNSIRDVVPEGGKLVLFDSKSVEHEVLPTSKERWAVVGWFLSDESSEKKKRHGDSGGTVQKRPHHSSGGEQVRNKKKKKRRRGR